MRLEIWYNWWLWRRINKDCGLLHPIWKELCYKNWTQKILWRITNFLIYSHSNIPSSPLGPPKVRCLVAKNCKRSKSPPLLLAALLDLLLWGELIKYPWKLAESSFSFSFSRFISWWEKLRRQDKFDNYFEIFIRAFEERRKEG